MEYVVYEFCKNQLKVIYSCDDHEIYDYLMLNCAYTDEENHYLVLGEL